MVGLAAVTACAWFVAVIGMERGRERPVRLAELALALALAWATWRALPPASIPTLWLTPQQEDATTAVLRAARAEAGHVGPVWTRWLSALAVVDVPGFGLQPRLDGAVRLHLAVSAAVAVGMVAVGRRAAGLAGVALVVWFAWQPVVRFAAASDGPAPVAWAAGWVAWTGWATARRCDGWRRRVAILAAAGAVALLAGVRLELAVGALIVPVAPAVGRWGAARPRWAWAAAFGAFGLTRAALARDGEVGQWVWALRAVDPADLSTLVLPFLVVALAGPGALLLFGSALRGALRAEHGGVALAWLLLSRLYLGAAHGPSAEHPGQASDYELLRYAGLIAPLWCGTALLGWRALAPRSSVGLWLLCAVPGLPAALRLCPWATGWTADAPEWAITGALETDLQREARAVVQAVRLNPGCAVITAVPARGGGVAWSVMPAPAQGASAMRAPPPPAPTLDEALAATPGCALLYEGGVCSAGLVGCDARGERLWSAELPSRPYLHPDHGWTPGATLRMAVRQLR